MGKNSDTPCTSDRITTSIILVNIFFRNLISAQIKQFRGNIIGMHNSQKYCK